jgi:hypothetical protein
MIQSISRGCKGTLSDGSVRYVFEFGPNDAADAAKLFGMPGTPSLCSAFTIEAAKQSAQDETIAADKPKGGQLAKLAGMWCDDLNFWSWLTSCGWKSDGIIDDVAAKCAIYQICNINSRAELDNNPEAAEKFHRLIREPYSEYLKTL